MHTKLRVCNTPFANLCGKKSNEQNGTGRMNYILYFIYVLWMEKRVLKNDRTLAWQVSGNEKEIANEKWESRQTYSLSCQFIICNNSTYSQTHNGRMNFEWGKWRSVERAQCVHRSSSEHWFTLFSSRWVFFFNAVAAVLDTPPHS